MDTLDEAPRPDPVPDCRLYVPEADNWQAHILKSWDKVYCFGKNPGEDFHHAILHGEVYLKGGDEVYCLRCALRDGIATQDRLFWQNRTRR
jgi:hypothetical protein